MENSVATYYKIYQTSKSLDKDHFDLKAFTFFMLSHKKYLCASVMNYIGSFPSSEPELRMLQKLWS